eukprot:TRINITY_DN1547_c1_g3_i2.p1 TRINITY_DN1547_c1_g3~~TRINITY_DN1547_c1_g3_i2.p1  ORF type:complete len:542 (+),score=168.21 TRINITY_DN1547_c1_g3_i2:90-1715(+)
MPPAPVLVVWRDGTEEVRRADVGDAAMTAAAVAAVLGVRPARWVLEAFDADYEEWIDYEEEQHGGARLRLREAAAPRIVASGADLAGFEGRTADAVRGALLEKARANGEAAEWVLEVYDDDFDEWVDVGADLPAITPALRLRLTHDPSPARPPGALTQRVVQLEEDLHRIVAAQHADVLAVPPVGTTTYGSLALSHRSDALSDCGGCPTSPGMHTAAGGDDHTAGPCPGAAPVLATDEAFALWRAGNGASVFFVDVRGEDEASRSGLIAGALRCHKGLLEWHADSASPLFTPVLLSGRTLVLYASGNVTEGGRPEHGARTLVDMGVPNVLVYKAGLTEWKALGHPVAEAPTVYPGVPATVTLRRTASDIIFEATKSTTFISVQAARELLDHRDIVFVDVRSHEEINATGVVRGAAVANRELMEWYCNPASQSHHRLFHSLFGSRTKLILYGGGLVGGGRPILASATLRRVLPYHQHVSVLEGGFTAWADAGLPTEPLAAAAACATPTAHDLPVAACVPRKPTPPAAAAAPSSGGSTGLFAG